MNDDDFLQTLEILKKYYNVNTIEEVVLAQDEQIAKLQKNLSEPFYTHPFYTQPLRVG